MNLKNVLDFEKKTIERAQAAIDSGEISGEGTEELMAVGEYLNDRVEQARTVITRRLKEEDFVRLMRIAQTTLMTYLIVSDEEDGTGLLFAAASGELNPFVQTIVLQVIGTLLDEEVL